MCHSLTSLSSLHKRHQTLCAPEHSVRTLRLDKMKALILSIIATLLAILVNAEICTDDICEYELVLRHTRTMVYKTTSRQYSVELNETNSRLQVLENLANPLPDDVIGTFVNGSDVITADGYRRTIVTINGQFPGPTIEVQEGSQVSKRKLK